MSGPLTSAVFLSLALLFAPHGLDAKPHGGRSRDGSSRPLRLRRDLRDSLPYEAEMMSYPPAEGQGNDLYYQPEAWRGQGLSQALQRLLEDDRRRDQEAAYLAGLVRLLSESEGNTQQARREEEGEDSMGPRVPYPPDYDETEQGLSMAKPQVAWQGLLDPQLTQALLNRYRQERLLQAGLTPNRVQESRAEPRADERDEEVLRYLVGRVLSSLAADNSQASPPRLAKRDLGAVAGGSGGAAAAKRSRRSVDSVPLEVPNPEPSLMRVKRLEEEEEEKRAAQVGLQRMKRIENEQPSGKHSRKRRALAYEPSVLAQRILQYLPQ